MHDTPSADPPPNRVELVLLAAVARNGVIGADGRLPWRLPGDLRRFRILTTGHTLLMGRRTWTSIGRPLAGRENIVVSRTLGAPPPGCRLARSLDDAIAMATRPGPRFCIGGGELYRAALPLASRLELTEIDRDFEGDATFPALDREQWTEVRREEHRDQEASLGYAFVTYLRRAWPAHSRGGTTSAFSRSPSAFPRRNTTQAGPEIGFGVK